MPTHTIEKYDAIFSPGSEIDYGRNWGDAANGDLGWLQPNEIITLSDWTITSNQEKAPTLVLGSQGEGIDTDGKITFIFVTGGTEGISYYLSNSVTTNDADSGVVRKETRTGIVYCCKK